MNTGARGPECGRCGDLEARFKDPATPNPGAYLYRWATHHLDDHGTVPGPREGCAECERYGVASGRVRADVWARWRDTHYMTCVLAPDWAPPEPSAG